MAVNAGSSSGAGLGVVLGQSSSRSSRPIGVSERSERVLGRSWSRHRSFDSVSGCVTACHVVLPSRVACSVLGIVLICQSGVGTVGYQNQSTTKDR